MKSVAYGGQHGEHRSASMVVWGGGYGSFKPSLPETESFYKYTKAKFYRLFACFTLCFRLTVYKKICLNSTFSNEVWASVN